MTKPKTPLMRFLLNIWFRGWADGYEAGQLDEVEHYTETLRRICKKSPSGIAILRLGRDERVEITPVNHAVIEEPRLSK